MYYLAYGSNLHPLRLVLRVPGARFVGTARLEGYRLTFHKRSKDGSSKCNLDFTNNFSDAAHGAVYEVPYNEIHLLDEAEGPGYLKEQLQLHVNGALLTAFVYLASQSHVVLGLEPYDWYKRFVLVGARKHQFSAEYLQQITEVTSKQDPDESRRFRMETLLVELED